MNADPENIRLTAEMREEIRHQIRAEIGWVLKFLGVGGLIAFVASAGIFINHIIRNGELYARASIEGFIYKEYSVFQEEIKGKLVLVREALNKNELMVTRVDEQVIAMAAKASSVSNKVKNLETGFDGGNYEKMSDLLVLIKEGKTDVFSKILTDIEALKNTVSSKISECRICFIETERSDQCGGNHDTCGDWSPRVERAWTEKFRDDTDNRGGGCTYQWRVECR